MASSALPSNFCILWTIAENHLGLTLKLNENFLLIWQIENILVDAEHWRNEYEELLNLKLAVSKTNWHLHRSSCCCNSL